MQRRSIIQAGLVFVTLLLFYGGFRQSRDWNTASRLLLTASLVQDHSIDVSPYVSQNGQLLENPLTRDLAVNDHGSFFSDKAPGSSFWAATGYAALAPMDLEPLPKPVPSSIEWRAEHWITWLTSGLATVATAALIVLFVTQLDSSLFVATVVALAFGLSTIAFPYATLLYGHSVAGFWCTVAVYALIRWPRSLLASGFAGVAAGLATITEYTLVVLPLSIVIAEVGIALLGRAGDRPGKRILIFIAGGLPLALLLGAYHAAVTGSPFRFPYSMEVHDELFGYHKEGYGIPISLPDWTVAAELLVGVRRGLIWYSPVVFGAVPGLWSLCRRGEGRLAAIIAGTFLGLFFINIGFPTWDGGWATGTRFLLPSFPLLLVATGAWLGTTSAGWLKYPTTMLKLFWGLAAIYGGAVMLGSTLAGVRFPPNLQNPLTDAVLPSLAEGRLADNFGLWMAARIGMPESGGVAVLIVTLVMATICGFLLWLARDEIL